jgi:4-hydroxy-3-methylbut-2-enyl diphosphate reductase IspH
MPKYLTAPIIHEGKEIQFYLILNWISSKTRGANTQALDEMGFKYVRDVSRLPKNGGVYITGYDANIEELQNLKHKNVPILERPCPWVRQLRIQISGMNSSTHQCVMMLDEAHMVYECYQSIIPEDAILVNHENYETCIRKYKNDKPIDLKVYATFRKKDAQRLIKHINDAYPHPDNILNGYKKTICNWSNQGLIEEISAECKKRRLTEVWVICSSDGDRSTISIINEILENDANPLIIKKASDVPDEISADARIGVLLAPIPLSTKTKQITNLIKQRFLQ